MRRAGPYLALAAVAALSGCSSVSESSYGQVWKLMHGSISAGLGKSRVTREQAAAIPYASMGWRLKQDNQSIVVLATDTGGQLLWTSAAHVVLVTRDGRLVRSVGLRHDLAGTAPKGDTELTAPAEALKAPFRSTRLVDYPDMERYGVVLDCQAKTAGRQTITILGRILATTRVDESCHSPTLRWSFTDNYWLDKDDGTVWRTRLHYHPREAWIETELFRPPG